MIRLALSFLFICVFSLPSRAQQNGPEICNGLSYEMWFAVGLEDQGNLITLGWARIGSHRCQFLNDLAAQEGLSVEPQTMLWLHAADDFENPSEVYGIGESLCVDRVFESFMATFADSTCAKRGYDRAEFSRILIQENYKLTLTHMGFN